MMKKKKNLKRMPDPEPIAKKSVKKVKSKKL